MKTPPNPISTSAQSPDGADSALAAPIALDAGGASLYRDAFGRLVWAPLQGTAQIGVYPVRAFPLGAPSEGIALVGPQGKEVAWIDQLGDLSPAVRTLLEEELAAREFMPVILRITHVSSFSSPSTWDVETDRGETQIVLRGEEYIRRLGAGALLITDLVGIQFLVPNLQSLDRRSRQLLDRFL
jgi:hypothetical protein